MNKLLLILMFFTFSAISGIQVSKNGDILDPGMYWAIKARYEFDGFSQGKGNKSDLMHYLKQSASYGFNSARFGIGMIYANGSNGFKQDLPRAYAWLSIAAKGKHKEVAIQRDQVIKNLSHDDLQRANTIFTEIESKYGNDAAFRKVQRWFRDSTTITGSRLRGNPVYLSTKHYLPGGKRISSSDLYRRLNEIYDEHLDNKGNQVIPQEIKIK
jgi:TPR repeat protein